MNESVLKEWDVSSVGGLGKGDAAVEGDRQHGRQATGKERDGRETERLFY